LNDDEDKKEYRLKPGVRVCPTTEGWEFSLGETKVLLEEKGGASVPAVRQLLEKSLLQAEPQSPLKWVHEATAWPPIVSRHLNSSRVTNQQGMIHLRAGDLPDRSLASTLVARRSPNKMRPLPQGTVCELGVYLKWAVGSDEDDRRMYPSAGPLYPNRIFVLNRQMESLEPGLYEYLSQGHVLFPCEPDGEVEKALVQPDMEFSFCLIIAVDLTRAEEGYGFRGIRFCLMEAGHMMQNLQLVAQAMDWYAAPIGGFRDRQAANILGKAGAELAPLYLVPVGKASERE